MSTNLEKMEKGADVNEIIKSTLCKSKFLSMLSNELNGKVSPKVANEILMAVRREKEFINSREMAKEMVQNWYTSIGKYSGKIPYKKDDDKGAIYWDAMRLSRSLGFKQFSNGEAVRLGEPFILEVPIQKMFNRMNSILKRVRESEFKIAEEKYMVSILPIVSEFEHSDEIEIEFCHRKAVKFIDDGTITEGSTFWKPVSWNTEVVKTKINKQDFMENYKRGFVRVNCWKGENIDFITFDMFKSVVS